MSAPSDGPDPEIVEWCRKVIKSARYRAQLEVALQERTAAKGVEEMVWHYAAGKPGDSVAHRFPDGVPGADLTTLSKQQLVARSKALTERLAELPDEPSDSTGGNGNGDGGVVH